MKLFAIRGGIHPDYRKELASDKAITALPIGTGATFNTANDIERVRSALYLTVSVPQGAIQK